MNIFNPKLMRNIYLYYFFILSISFAYPLYGMSKSLFVFVIMGFFFMSAAMVGKLFSLTFRKSFEGKFLTSFLRVIFLYFGIFILCIILDYMFNVINKVIMLLICWSLIVIVLIWTGRILWIMYSELQNMSRNEKSKKKIVVLCLLIIGLCFILPEFIIGRGYNLLFSVFYNVELNNLEAFYLSFVISYTLPVTDDGLSGYIKLINSEKILYTYQMVQVYSKRLIDLIIVALTVGYLMDVIGKKNEV